MNARRAGHRLLRPWPGDAQIARAVAGRDPYLDAVRTASLFVVVFGHMLMQIVYWPEDGGAVVTFNTFASGRPWAFVTWVLQVMPLFFIAGGVVNAAGYQRATGRGAGGRPWVQARIVRLMTPTLMFLTCTAVLAAVTGNWVTARGGGPLMQGVAGPLWFLAVYIPVLATTGWQVRWLTRPGRALVAVYATVVVVDVVARTVWSGAAVVNLLAVWVFAHMLGGSLASGLWTARRAVTAGVAALSANLVLTCVLGWYPVSMVGLPSQETSNMSPPTLAAANHVLVMFALFVALRGPVTGWLRRPAVQRVLGRGALCAMTAYLIHLTLLAWLFLGLHLIGRDLPTRLLSTDTSATGYLVVPARGYWAAWPAFALVFVVVVGAVVRVLWPLEHVRLPWLGAAGRGVAGRGSVGSLVAQRVGYTTGMVALCAGLLVCAGTGLRGFPSGATATAYGTFAAWQAYSLVVGGVLLCRLCAGVAPGPDRAPDLPNPPSAPTTSAPRPPGS